MESESCTSFSRLAWDSCMRLASALAVHFISLLSRLSKNRRSRIVCFHACLMPWRTVPGMGVAPAYLTCSIEDLGPLGQTHNSRQVPLGFCSDNPGKPKDGGWPGGSNQSRGESGVGLMRILVALTMWPNLRPAEAPGSSLKGEKHHMATHPLAFLSINLWGPCRRSRG